MESVLKKELSSADLPSSALKKNKRGSNVDSARAKKMAELSKRSPKNGKHGKLKKTLLLEDVYEQVKTRLTERALSLVNTQTVIAHGTIKVYKIASHWEGTGKNRKKVRGKPEIVTNEDEIAAAIDYEYGEGGNPNDDDEDEYFFVSTKDPDNKAIQSQLDRIFGKAASSVDITTKGKEIKTVVGMRIVDETEDDD